MARMLVVLLLVLSLLTGCTARPDQGRPPGSVELVVSAAASLRDALDEAAEAFQARDGGVQIRLNLGSSGALARQIEQGAPVDLFISAAAGPMDELVARGLIEEGAMKPLAANSVVLIRPRSAGGVSDWADLPTARRVALGNPEHVPAGQYGRAVLQRLDLWQAVEPKLILAEDVRQVLQFVEAGEVDGGIVYRSDTAGSERVEVVAAAPEGSHPPVIYPMAVLKEAAHAPAAKRFADFLRSPAGQAILTRHGFQPIDSPRRP